MARHLRVPRTIALVNKTEYLPITPTIGMDAVVSKKMLTVNAILRFIQKSVFERIETIPGIEAEVIDLRTLSPLDIEIIKKSVLKTSKVLILQEDKKTLGIASEISAFIAEELFDDLDGPVVRITAPDTHVPFSPPLEEFYLPDVKKTVGALRKLASY